MEDWKKRLEELSFTKGYYFKLGENGLVEKKDDQLIFNREMLESFIEQEIEKAREEGYKKGYIDGQTEKTNKPKPVMSEFDKTSYLN